MTKNIELDYFRMDYDQAHIFSKREDIVLEAKRVLLNEQLDKISNITLSEVTHSRKCIGNCILQCKDSSNWDNNTFWKELKKPLMEVEHHIIDENVRVIENIFVSDSTSVNNNAILKSETDKPTKTKSLLKKYFDIWKETVKLKNEKVKLIKDKIDKRTKLDKFIKKLKKHQKQEKMIGSKDEVTEQMSRKPRPSSNYRNRFIAQKNVINLQKAKLEEQNKMIEELKLGIIRQDLLKTLEHTKISIREIFNNCSEKIKCKIPILLIEENQKFMISTQKAPKIVQQMEQRALQRAQNRQIILERKRLIEESRQKMLEEAIEKKRAMEEEERKKNLDLIKETRKKELELEKIRRAHKQKYLSSLSKATEFYNKLLTKNCFKELYNYFKECRKHNLLAEEHYKTKILQKSISCWYDFVEEKYKIKYNVADAHFAYKVLKRSIKVWYNFYIDAIRNMQVAEDIYDFHLTSHCFLQWHKYVCTEIVLQMKQIDIAKNHYNRKILLQYYYQWRSLPAVIQLEKAKELKKQRWREKVWEVLPDYKPPDDV